MITVPLSFRPDHKARVVVHHDMATSDPYENLENLASDAIAVARFALEQLRGWAPDDFGAARRSWQSLREAVQQRDPLHDTFRQSASTLADALDGIEAAPEVRQRLDTVSDALRRATELSDRVSDLLAVEAVIARQRGLAD